MATKLSVKIAEALERARWRRGCETVAGVREAVSPQPSEIADIIDAAGVKELVAKDAQRISALQLLTKLKAFITIDIIGMRNSVGEWRSVKELATEVLDMVPCEVYFAEKEDRTYWSDAMQSSTAKTEPNGSASTG